VVLLLSNAKYVLDTNVFINMQRLYPPDVVSSLWVKMAELIDDGIAISCSEVFDELSIGSDDLIEWVKLRGNSFVISDASVQEEVRDILLKHPNLVVGTRKANNADPFVIALAKKTRCTLVSDETRAGANNPVKIPNVCDAYGIKLIKFVDFLREMKINI